LREPNKAIDHDRDEQDDQYQQRARGTDDWLDS